MDLPVTWSNWTRWFLKPFLESSKVLWRISFHVLFWVTDTANLFPLLTDLVHSNFLGNDTALKKKKKVLGRERVSKKKKNFFFFSFAEVPLQFVGVGNGDDWILDRKRVLGRRADFAKCHKLLKVMLSERSAPMKHVQWKYIDWQSSLPQPRKEETAIRGRKLPRLQ